MRVMQIYWAVAGLVSLAIAATSLTSTSANCGWFPLVVVTLVLAIPAGLVRVDLIDLIVMTGKRLREPIA